MRPAEKRKAIARKMAEYNLLALPVVDASNKLLGVVTVDDALDALLPEGWKLQGYLVRRPNGERRQISQVRRGPRRSSPQRNRAYAPLYPNAHCGGGKSEQIGPAAACAFPIPFKRLRRLPFWAYLAVLGPGVIAAAAGNDAGGIATYAQVGATYGYSLLWAMLVMTFCLLPGAGDVRSHGSRHRQGSLRLDP